MKSLGFLSARIVLCCAAVSLYLLVWRPARVLITEQLVYPRIERFDSLEENFESELRTGALIVDYRFFGTEKQLHYRPQFGFYFLIALVSLLFITADKVPYLALAALHLGGSVLTYLLLMLGAAGFAAGFMLTDVVSGYLIPAVSLALVLLVGKGSG